MTEEQRKTLLRSQQGELDGVETYLMLADTVHNPSDQKAFRQLAADEGRHAAIIKKYTGTILRPGKLQARTVSILYDILGKKILYPLIARFEYDAIPKYRTLERDFPELGSVMNDEKRHGDIINMLAKNGEEEDEAKWPIILAAILFLIKMVRIIRMIRRLAVRSDLMTDPDEKG